MIDALVHKLVKKLPYTTRAPKLYDPLESHFCFIMDTVTTLWELNTLDNAKDYLTNQAHKPLRLQNFVDNAFSAYPQSDEWIDSFDPRTGEIPAQIPRSTQADVDRAVDAASRAFPSWSQTPRHERSETLLRIADCLSGERELFAVWESIDQGKTLARARIEVERAISNFRLVLLLTLTRFG